MAIFLRLALSGPTLFTGLKLPKIAVVNYSNLLVGRKATKLLNPAYSPCNVFLFDKGSVRLTHPLRG